METKICGKCKLPKSTEDFHKNPTKKDGLQSMCKECRKEYHRDHYLRNKEKYISKAREYRDSTFEWLNEIKSHLKCKICNEDRYWVLDFHHPDPSEKDMEISKLVQKGNRKRILEEMKKCDVLCATCHRDVHFQEKMQK